MLESLELNLPEVHFDSEDVHIDFVSSLFRRASNLT